MDKDAEKAKLEDAQAFIQSWLEHPITRELSQESREQEEALVKKITSLPCADVPYEAFAESKGELTGIRRWRGLVEEKLDEIKEKIKELE